ncbi:ABC transporter permease [Roseovarius sp. ZX-A-9]|uniref:ABC transporter permease n=1 Tax=Roseovarius sp. ZX-A-9 TaxID=3014783 RepID=UPI002330E015|nr:ABC transporter permease [Roseovarius sp. ZX-A-9]
MNFDVMIEALPDLIDGLWLTLGLVALALLVGFVIALPTALARLSPLVPLRVVAGAYVFFFRGTPLLVQIFLIYYGLSQFEGVRDSILWPVLREPFWCTLIALALNTGAYTAEVFRGGILSVPHNQIEAARAVGMSAVTAFRRIIWPQTIRQALPAYGNEMILMVKASSLASTVTLMDITGVARTLASETYMPIEIYTMAAMIYLALTFSMSQVIHLLECKMDVTRARA